MLDRLPEVMKDSVIPKQLIIEMHSEMDRCTQARANGQLSMMSVHWWTLLWNEIVRLSMIFLEDEQGAGRKGFGNQHVSQCVQRFLSREPVCPVLPVCFPGRGVSTSFM